MLVKDTTSVRNVVAFLWNCGIPVVYHHSGHLGNQDRLAQVMHNYLSTPGLSSFPRKAAVISHSITQLQGY